MVENKDRTPDPTATSVRLLRRAKVGETGALEALLQRQVPRLFRWASGRLPRWARDLADTADIVQDSLLNVLRNVDHLEAQRRGALQAYLRQAVLNRIRDECRRATRRPRGDLDDGQADGTNTSPLESLIGREAAERYEAALQNLRSEDQRAVVARIELGYSYDQIALVLGRPSADAARMAVGRALVRLAEEMARARSNG